MPVAIQIEAETGIAIASCCGVLRLHDAQTGASALWRTPTWNGTAAVWDFRAAEFDLTPPEVREIARFILEQQPAPPPSKIAFVTQRDVDFGMSRMFEVFRADPNTALRVFRDYDEAISWARAPVLGDA